MKTTKDRARKATGTKPSLKWLAIKSGTDMVTGYIEGFWCARIKRYVTIPGASRFLDPHDPENMELVASLEFAAASASWK